MQNSNVFRVYVNQVEVGAIPEQDYRTIVSEAIQSVKQDRRLYLAQALNLIGCVCRAGSMMIQAIPFIFTLLLVIALVVAPDGVTEVIAAFRTATPAEFTQALQKVLFVCFCAAAVFWIPIKVAFTNNNFGYFNQFESAKAERISRRIRVLLEVPAEGNVDVHLTEGFRW